ncbi:MAG: methyl-accepting chemotaxis protein, partial [Burkholderiaceae bacterium]|nr:methyl-accepting chemotaxis protein [Burkholderiaceae bacterium]
AGLSQVVSVFKLDQNQRSTMDTSSRTASAPQRPAHLQPPRARRAIAAPPSKRVATASALSAEGNWETF